MKKKRERIPSNLLSKLNGNVHFFLAGPIVGPEWNTHGGEASVRGGGV